MPRRGAAAARARLLHDVVRVIATSPQGRGDRGPARHAVHLHRLRLLQGDDGGGHEGEVGAERPVRGLDGGPLHKERSVACVWLTGKFFFMVFKFLRAVHYIKNDQYFFGIISIYIYFFSFE